MADFSIDQIRSIINQSQEAHEDARGKSGKGPEYENGFCDAHDALLQTFIYANLKANEVSG